MGPVAHLKFPRPPSWKARNALRADDVSWLLRSAWSLSTAWSIIFKENMETYTRIFSVFRLVTATKGYTVWLFDCTKQPQYVIRS